MSEETLANVSEEVVTATPEAEQEQTAPPSEETSKSDETTQTEDKTEKVFTQKEVDDAIQKRLARESRKLERIAKAEAETAYLRQQLAEIKNPRQETQANAAPDVSQFKTYEEYLDKLADFKLEQKLKGFEQKSQETQQRQSMQAHEDQMRQNLNKAADKYEDFTEVVESIPSQYITIPMRDAIGESDIAGDVAYYLGNNHKEAADIAKMTPVQQVKAIDRIEAKLKAPAQVSKAPPPANTVGKARATSEIDLNKASLDDYMAARKKQGARWAR